MVCEGARSQSVPQQAMRSVALAKKVREATCSCVRRYGPQHISPQVGLSAFWYMCLPVDMLVRFGELVWVDDYDAVEVASGSV